jgi:hypothetical protein
LERKGFSGYRMMTDASTTTATATPNAGYHYGSVSNGHK